MRERMSGLRITRIFDLFEELPFAGHPLIGAAAVLHAAVAETDARTWRFQLGNRFVLISGYAALAARIGSSLTRH
jgi:trans-2,3-dihydro-3-hydroxyanthranilate isomerase